MNFRTFLAFTSALVAIGAVRPLHAADNGRFSKALAPTEHAAVGLERLSSDQVAVLDALVRRDVARSEFVNKEPRAARFSERLTADERDNAGLLKLSASELTQLDAYVQRLITPMETPSGSLVTGVASRPYSVPSVKLRRDPSIHGHITLGVAVGSDGYSAYGGGVVLDYLDPANKFGLSIGYSEVRSKGGALYRGGCYDGYGSYRDRYYGRPFGPLDGFW